MIGDLTEIFNIDKIFLKVNKTYILYIYYN